MRVVVTGASGVVGTALLRRLDRRADAYAVTGVVRRPPPRRRPCGRVDWHVLDVAAADAPLRLRQICAGADVVVHLAWSRTGSLGYRYAAGIGGSTAVFDAVERTGVRQVVFASSAAVYAPGNRGRPVDETWPVRGPASSVYGRTKAAVETQLDDLASRRTDMMVSRIRVAAIAGNVPKHELQQHVSDEIVTSVALVDDVADVLLRIVDGRHGGAFNVATDTPVGGDGLAALLPGADRHWIDLQAGAPPLDTGRARDVPGWVPSVAELRDPCGGNVTSDSADPSPPTPSYRYR